MKKKVKRLYPRRERALRTAGLALALLLLCNGVLHLGFLLPAQADAYAAQRYGVYGPLKTVAVQWKPGMLHKTGRLSLLEGENSLSLRYTYWNLYGWEPSFLWALDTSDDADVHAGVVSLTRDTKEHILVFYGRVRGTDVTSLYANIKVWAFEDHVYIYGNEIGAEEQYVKDGYTYFFSAVTDPVPAEWRGGESYQLQINRSDADDAWDGSYEPELTAGVWLG